jgi:hypothetical protein
MRNLKDDEFQQIVAETNGVIFTEEIVKRGIERGSLSKYIDDGRLIRAYRGVYITPGTILDKCFILQRGYGRGIFSHRSALYLNGLLDVEPEIHVMTFPRGYNPRSPEDRGVEVKRIIPELYEMGVMDIETPMGHIVKSYGPERALCDVLRGSKPPERDIEEAFRRYKARPEANIDLLKELSRPLHVEKRLERMLNIIG